MTTLSDLQDKWFAEDMALGQKQSASEMSALKGSSVDWLQLGASVLGKAMESSTPTTASSESAGAAGFDNSGWNVNFGNGAVQTSKRQQLPAVGGFGMAALLIVIAAALLLPKRKRRA